MSHAPPPNGSRSAPSDVEPPYRPVTLFHALGCIAVVLPLVLLGLWMLDGGEDAPPRGAIRAEIRELMKELDAYAGRHGGTYPKSLEALGEERDGMRGAYPHDLWKQPYRYEPPHAGETRPHVWSVGEDSESGTSDDVDSGELVDE